ncbi:MAG: tetratricopeptide repeat protein, partial [Myxococcales bacterium]|nr:tetratricopeptide repeat protein [Myxococcales bacterium]
ELEGLLVELANLESDPRPERCEWLDHALAEHREGPRAQLAQHAQAELARACGDEDRWRAEHQQLVAAGYRPAMAPMLDDAVARGDWARAEATLATMRRAYDDSALDVRLDRIEVGLVHGRWVTQGEARDFEVLRGRLQSRLIEDGSDLDAHAALLRLQVEQAALVGEPADLLMAQLIEGQARRTADELGHSTPALELASGFVRELEGRRADAVAYWQAALALNAAANEPRLWLGLAAIERRDYAEAQAQLERYLEQDPDDVEAWLALGVALHHGGGPRIMVLRAYRRAQELAPHDLRPAWNEAVDTGAWDGTVPGEWDAARVRKAEAQRAFLAAADREPEQFECEPRGEGEADPACVRRVQQLLDARLQAWEELKASEAEDDWTCCLGCNTIEVDPEVERRRRDQLLELERKAMAEAEAAGAVPVEQLP